MKTQKYITLDKQEKNRVSFIGSPSDWCCRCVLLFVFFILTGVHSVAQAKEDSSIAFYYGHVDSVRELLTYKRVVVSAEQLTNSNVQQLKNGGTRVYAYLSVSEWDNTRNIAKPKAKELGANKGWGSSIMDLSDTVWQKHLLDQSEKLLKQGFDGLFLDTLDSYNLLNDAQLKAQQQAALVDLLNKLAETVPALILNRGFEAIEALKFKPEAIVAESMFNAYDVVNNEYTKQPASDTEWLDQRLQQLNSKGIETIVIDYLPASNSLKQRITAVKKIIEKGHTPYVSNGLLTQFGVSTRYPIPRRILSFYDGNNQLKKQSNCHRFLSVLIEYNGYVPDCRDIRELEHFKFDTTRYASAVFWLAKSAYESNEVVDLVHKVLDTIGTSAVFIGELPENQALLKRLGVKLAGQYQGTLSLEGAELEYRLPAAEIESVDRYIQDKDESKSGNDELVSAYVVDQHQQRGIGVLQADWGGIFAKPLGVSELVGGRLRWSIAPFDHLMPLLKLPPIPAPDISTESGQRIMTAHIDGDGFPSKTWTGDKVFAGESILKNILERYPLPHTVSIIEGEIAAHGLYPQHSEELEQIAREIFALDHVEVASHTFSHPFFWDDRLDQIEKQYGDSLDIPDYTVDYTREVLGSVDYIENKLLTGDIDKHVKVFLWSGMANPTPDVIAKTAAKGLYNVNGGNTYVVTGNYSIAQVYPHINWYEEAVQVYAPLMNENLFTELWSENFHGFSRAIESFRLLGEPRRLKPIGIYYHMYSGIYPASLKALNKVYSWALEQNTTPLYLSEYAKRASNLYETGIGRSLFDRGWYVVSTGIRSLRVLNEHVPSSLSDGVIGLTEGPDGNYLSLVQPRIKLMFKQSATTAFDGHPYLAEANGIIEKWQWQGQQLNIEGVSHAPLRLKVNNAKDCELDGDSSSEMLQVSVVDDSLNFQRSQRGAFFIRLNCTGNYQSKVAADLKQGLARD